MAAVLVLEEVDWLPVEAFSDSRTTESVERRIQPSVHNVALPLIATALAPLQAETVHLAALRTSYVVLLPRSEPVDLID
ncbi:hypothetical protein HBI81_244670 [Parastagonospora nodorum]|nr:hypothetical protein HBI05_251290 [Parastagonospora nodorum]KAH4914258.1 hypothetical protein HBH73_252010 [Parastagonospora nodorum]KAH5088883.1 hypothetical protein HBH72_239400 [Parastagonospora nodorum]KAH5552721.1 hypothetical protein HBI26_242380 [Parastagonospora nodorum]KAH6259705.1 hypothetical protein HBI40_245940 [Parastagonospora nodorum]